MPLRTFQTYATESQHKPLNKTVKNRILIPDFPRGDAVPAF